MFSSSTGFTGSEKVIYFVIPSGARNLSSMYTHEKKERFLAPLGMTKRMGAFFRNLFSLLGCVSVAKIKTHRLKPVLLDSLYTAISMATKP